MNDYEVIIIGGRPAGSTLAARLGKQGVRTLLLERAAFPSLPAASSPIIYAPTMKMLDEIGADESEYARGTPKIRRLYIESAAMSAGFPIPEDAGRDYGYAIDRARFDAALWRTASRYPSVEAREGFNVTDLLREGDRVTGIVGLDAQKNRHTIKSNLVIGADGRFSLVARTMNAAVIDEHDTHPTTLYYAYWKNVRPHKGEAATSVAYEGIPGLGYLMMDSADDTAAVCVEGRAELLNPLPGEVNTFYLEMLKSQPAVWERLVDAEMVTDVRGMRKIGNLYRQAGGDGWALVGDAYHQKDPLDGQGIYNAVFTAKALAWAIRYWRSGEKTWDDALDWYDETARIKTYAMYKSLLNRVQTSFYAAQPEIPPWAQQTVLRWISEDPEMHRLFGRMITRQIPADAVTLMSPPVMARAVMRGGLRDLRERIEAMLPPLGK